MVRCNLVEGSWDEAHLLFKNPLVNGSVGARRKRTTEVHKDFSKGMLRFCVKQRALNCGCSFVGDVHEHRKMSSMVPSDTQSLPYLIKNEHPFNLKHNGFQSFAVLVVLHRRHSSDELGTNLRGKRRSHLYRSCGKRYG